MEGTKLMGCEATKVIGKVLERRKRRGNVNMTSNSELGGYGIAKLQMSLDLQAAEMQRFDEKQTSALTSKVNPDPNNVMIPPTKAGFGRIFDKVSFSTQIRVTVPKCRVGNDASANVMLIVDVSVGENSTVKILLLINTGNKTISPMRTTIESTKLSPYRYRMVG